MASAPRIYACSVSARAVRDVQPIDRAVRRRLVQRLQLAQLLLGQRCW